MRIVIIGGGWYGCHLGLSLSGYGHQIELHETADQLFAGASGGNPARLHKGFHYPRSRLTRAACLEHEEAFMRAYGHLTRHVPVNIYAVAAQDSLVDFGTYREVLEREVALIPFNPFEVGLRHCEGAVLTGERHIVIKEARAYFTEKLRHLTVFNSDLASGGLDLASRRADLVIDCTFCAHDAEGVDRYEPCVVGLLKGPTDWAVTIMDGPFPSIYPWDEEQGLNSISSASLTPLSKCCRTHAEAVEVLQAEHQNLVARVSAMQEQMRQFWPASADRFQFAGLRTSIRAMPRSGADARLVDVVTVSDKVLRVRAGKIDAVFRAEKLVREFIGLC